MDWSVDCTAWEQELCDDILGKKLQTTTSIAMEEIYEGANWL